MRKLLILSFIPPPSPPTAITDRPGDYQIMTSEVFNPLYDVPYYLQPTFTIPILTAFVVIVIVIIFAFVCVRKIRHRAAADGCEYY